MGVIASYRTGPSLLPEVGIFIFFLAIGEIVLQQSRNLARIAPSCDAQVAKLVDAPGSGPGGGNTVEVRVFSWAPFNRN
jgi:hypothetical protein